MVPDIVTWAQSERGFYVDRIWDGVSGTWRMGYAPIRLAPYHADLLRHLFTPDDTGRMPYDTIAWCEPAKSGKSAIAGLVAEYTALHCDQNSYVIMASNKERQAASIMFASALDSVEHSPFLPRVETKSLEILFSNGNTIRAIPSSARGEAGARFSLALFDEPWGYVHEDAVRLWSEFKTDPTRQASMKMATGYAGYLESELWLETLQAGLQGEPVPELEHITDDAGAATCWRNGRHFTFWSHTCRQPWQTQEWRDSLGKGLRTAEYRRMILTEFVESIGSFVELEMWESLVDSELRPLEPNKITPVYVGLDLALSPRGDDCALIGVYSHPSGKVAVAFHKVWKGRTRIRKLKLGQTVKPYLLQKAQDYRITGLYFDPWQAQLLTDELRLAGLNCIAVPQTRSTRAPKDSRLFEMVANRELMLYDHPELRKMAAGANAQELGDGRIFLKKASGRSQIDLLVALSNCANEASTGPSVTYAPGLWGPSPWVVPETSRERLAKAHDPRNPAHLRYAQRHYCHDCYLAFCKESGEEPDYSISLWR